jgi:hypothetical protein
MEADQTTITGAALGSKERDEGHWTANPFTCHITNLRIHRFSEPRSQSSFVKWAQMRYVHQGWASPSLLFLVFYAEVVASFTRQRGVETVCSETSTPYQLSSRQERESHATINEAAHRNASLALLVRIVASSAILTPADNDHVSLSFRINLVNVASLDCPPGKRTKSDELTCV